MAFALLLRGWVGIIFSDLCTWTAVEQFRRVSFRVARLRNLVIRSIHALTSVPVFVSCLCRVSTSARSDPPGI